MKAPVGFYDTTPLGQIMNRLSKGPSSPKYTWLPLNPHPNHLDVDTIDNVLGDAIRMFVGTLAQIVGAIVLVSVHPYFLIAFMIILIPYYWVGIYYRPSAREIRVRQAFTYHFR